jgi:hypothetical protein
LFSNFSNFGNGNTYYFNAIINSLIFSERVQIQRPRFLAETFTLQCSHQATVLSFSEKHSQTISFSLLLKQYQGFSQRFNEQSTISTCMHLHFLVVILLLLEALVHALWLVLALATALALRLVALRHGAMMVFCGSKISCKCMYYAKCKLPSARNCVWSLSTCSRLGPCACTPRAFATPPCIPPVLCQLLSPVTANISVYEHALCDDSVRVRMHWLR